MTSGIPGTVFADFSIPRHTHGTERFLSLVVQLFQNSRGNQFKMCIVYVKAKIDRTSQNAR